MPAHSPVELEAASALVALGSPVRAKALTFESALKLYAGSGVGKKTRTGPPPPPPYPNPRSRSRTPSGSPRSRGGSKEVANLRFDTQSWEERDPELKELLDDGGRAAAAFSRACKRT